MVKSGSIAAAVALGSILAFGGMAGCSSESSTGDGSAPIESKEDVSGGGESSENKKPEGMTPSQEQAYEKALTYLSTMPFSHDGLVKQLEHEQFSTEDAVFAADNCGADWGEQALLKAKQYLSTMPFSQTGLSSQLQFDGFAVEDSDNAAANVGADWTEQATKKAKSYLDTMAFSHSQLVDQLVFDGFTSEQAEAGVVANGL